MKKKSRQVGRKIGRVQCSTVTNFVRERERADADDGMLLALCVSSFSPQGYRYLDLQQCFAFLQKKEHSTLKWLLD
jgi:hypothetical protein